jgi:protein SERAC1
MAASATVFRVTGLPTNQTDDELTARLKSFIDENLQEKERSGCPPSVDLVPSCPEYNHGPTALVEFVDGVPQFLSHLIKNPLGDWQMEMDDNDVNFDRHFHGFTQLYASEPVEAVTAE